MPSRIQLSRQSGWHLPEGAKSVANGTVFGNPFRVGGYVIDIDDRPPGTWPQRIPPVDGVPGLRKVRDRADAVALFIRWVPHVQDLGTGLSYAELARRGLAGRDLACWCPAGEPCHADAVMALANGRRMFTPDVPLPDGAIQVTAKRYCNGCAEPVGDVTDEEMAAAVSGQPLPDVRGECLRCSAELDEQARLLVTKES